MIFGFDMEFYKKFGTFCKKFGTFFPEISQAKNILEVLG